MQNTWNVFTNTNTEIYLQHKVKFGESQGYLITRGKVAF